ncbi:hypothetical protein [Jiangella sp. DSM 45060]|uniref:hypothetical protein n=1 Tax=Jiangella sp. DSM 45060 TaxID=1798224 RepID=UPI00087A72BF|nr:hypothetical protein [Jiangella sp. DSM 45060]SDT69445.1 hypothetical protein SAMN04515669_6022 [Jiangella sp. DSM 45060]
MTTTITDGTTTLTPLLVLGWAPARQARTRVHQLLGRPDPDVTLRPHALRAGQLRILCADEVAAAAMEQMHAAGTVLTLADDDVATAAMAYVVSGQLTTELDQVTLLRWVVTADFTEVLP